MTFCLKIGTCSIVEELIPNLELDFRNFDPTIYFWGDSSRESIHCLFSFETLLLLLDIQLLLVLSFKITLHSSVLHFTGVLVPVLSKFTFTPFCSNFTIFVVWVWYPFSNYSKTWNQLINNCAHTKWVANCVRLKCNFDFVSKLYWSNNMKYVDCNHNLIYPTFFCWLLHFYL